MWRHTGAGVLAFVQTGESETRRAHSKLHSSGRLMWMVMAADNIASEVENEGQ